MHNLKDIRHILPYYRKYIPEIIISCIMILSISLLLLPTPFLTRRLFDKTIPESNYSELIIIIIIVSSLLIISKTIGYFQNQFFFRINNRIILNIRTDILKKINRIPLRKFQKFGNGYLISRINDDTMKLQNLFADTLIGIIKDLLTLIVGLTALLFIHWKLALLSTAILPLFICTAYIFGKKNNTTVQDLL